MSFQAYIDNIQTKTGKTPEELKDLAEKAGVYSYDMQFSTLKTFLKEEFNLGHGHSMAIWAYWKQKDWIPNPKNK